MAGKGRIENLDPIRSKDVARERQKLSAAKRSENVKQRKAVREIFEDKLRERGYKDIDLWIENLMQRAMDNSKDMEFALAIMGEKPKEQVEITQEKPFEVTISVVE